MDQDVWQDRAACRGVDVEVFYSADERDLRRALSLCAQCPVQPACLETAMRERDPHGVWGGTPESQRRRIFRAERRGSRQQVA